MKKSVVTACVTAALLAAPAFAGMEYHYQYTFASYPFNVSGYFWGIADGDLITHISHISLFVRDNEGNLRPDYGPATGTTDDPGGGDPVVSFSGKNNNFAFYNGPANFGVPGEEAFFFSLGGNLQDKGSAQEGLDYFFTSGGSDATWYFVEDLVPVATTWSVTAVSAVPEPQTWALVGLGLAGLIANGRRKAKHERVVTNTTRLACA